MKNCKKVLLKHTYVGMHTSFQHNHHHCQGIHPVED